jgi:N-carbamoyl-L-amino-acid hydrolase
MTATSPHVNAARLAAEVRRLGAIGTDPGGGVTRLAFTSDDVAGRAYVTRLMEDASLAVEVDAAGNLIGRRAGRNGDAPTLVIGSHIDTVVQGGAYDGAYGVLAGIEVARTLTEEGIVLDHPLAVVAFCNEEGARGTMGMWGSHAFAGVLPQGAADQVDEYGIAMADLLRSVGGDADLLDGAAWTPGSIAAYFELHVEQGGVLESLDVPIGVVESIIGRANVSATVEGVAGHAGTTPMDQRVDALVVAARLVEAVRSIAAEEGLVLRATAGTITAEPGMWNVIPGRVRLGVEFRDASAVNLDRATDRLERIARQVERDSGARVGIETGARTEPVGCDPDLQELIAKAAAEHGHLVHHLPSGAGHDAQIIARIAPVGMIFVPSAGGISHAPAEYTAPHHLGQGADVLLSAVLKRDRIC